MSAREFGNELLTRLLTHAMDAIPGAVGVGLSLAADSRDGGGPHSVAAVGIAADLDRAQWLQGAGPLWEALGSGSVVTRPPTESDEATGSSWTSGAVHGSAGAEGHHLAGHLVEGPTQHTPPSDDGQGDGDAERLPGSRAWLVRRLLDLGPGAGVGDDLAIEVRGAVFSAGEWGGDVPVVVSVYLDREPDFTTVQEFDRHEPVITHALAVVEYCAGEETLAEQMVQMTQYRRVIEQAKGLVMGATGRDSHAAFETLARASQHFNVRLRHLAVALVEHVGGAEAEHPDDPELVVHPSGNDREVARRVWAALSSGPLAAAPASRMGAPSGMAAPSGTGAGRP